jgi:hypothetical protein
VGPQSEFVNDTTLTGPRFFGPVLPPHATTARGIIGPGVRRPEPMKSPSFSVRAAPPKSNWKVPTFRPALCARPAGSRLTWSSSHVAPAGRSAQDGPPSPLAGMIASRSNAGAD